MMDVHEVQRLMDAYRRDNSVTPHLMPEWRTISAKHLHSILTYLIEAVASEHEARLPAATPEPKTCLATELAAILAEANPEAANFPTSTLTADHPDAEPVTVAPTLPGAPAPKMMRLSKLSRRAGDSDNCSPEIISASRHEIIEAARLDAIDYAADRCAQARNDYQAKLAAVEAQYRDEAAKLRARIEVKTPQSSTVGVSKP